METSVSLYRIIVISKRSKLTKIAQEYSDQILTADNLIEALDIIENTESELILLDAHLGISNILEFLNTLYNYNNAVGVPKIVVGDNSFKDNAVEELKKTSLTYYLNGEQDCWRLEKIITEIKNKDYATLDNKENTNGFFIDDFAAAFSMVGQSKGICYCLKMIKLVAQSRCNPVLIVGQTGTGKELAARAIHSLRHHHEPFVAVNCAALTANLLESELFGHVKGAFTSADREKTGLLELAGTGTLFLDEISEMPLDLQAKLLRVIQEKNFRKVGGVENITCHATIIASSNRNLKKEVEDKKFRHDLFYRLNICPIILAPLQSPQRKEDIKLLAKYFLEISEICPQKNPKITSMTQLALKALEKHDWPGNIRELQNVIERAILLETTDKIGLSSIIIDPFKTNALTGEPTDEQLKSFSLENAERKLISRALQETGWQKTRAATLLGITRATLYAKLKQYNIEKGFYINNELENEMPESSSAELINVK